MSKREYVREGLCPFPALTDWQPVMKLIPRGADMLSITVDRLDDHSNHLRPQSAMMNLFMENVGYAWPLVVKSKSCLEACIVVGFSVRTDGRQWTNSAMDPQSGAAR